MVYGRIRTALQLGVAAVAVLGGNAVAPAGDAYMTAVLADGPVGYWRMNETHAGGDGLIGPIYNDATGLPIQEDAARGYYDFGSTAGVSKIGDVGPRPPAFPGFDDDNRAPWFDGINDLVFINSKPAYEITGALTLEAWVNPDVLQTQSIVGKFDTGSNKRSYLLQVIGNRRSEVGGRQGRTVGAGAAGWLCPSQSHLSSSVSCLLSSAFCCPAAGRTGRKRYRSVGG